MEPRSPFIQAFDELPDRLPIYPLENALLPGGELPLELSGPAELALFSLALETDRLVGLVQPRPDKAAKAHYQTGCAGRVRQYRERKDGRLNVMLTGVCRFRIVEEMRAGEGYLVAGVDWSGFEIDYRTEDIEPPVIDDFWRTLRAYFDRHHMQADWKVLDRLPIEQVVNNLVLVMNLDIVSKQSLLEAPTVRQRLDLFSSLLKDKENPILVSSSFSSSVN